MMQFPRTEVAGISLPRMLIGSNWVLGYSHTSTSADEMIRSTHATKESIIKLIEAYLEYGIDAMMAPFKENTPLMEAIKTVEDKHGRPIIRIDTPIINVDDNEQARVDTRRQTEASAKIAIPSA